MNQIAQWILIFVVSADAQQKVENGTAVSAQNSLSRSVALMQSPTGICSASFLTKKMLVTAAHCTSKVSASAVTIKVKDASGLWKTASVQRLITHPQYQRGDYVGGTKVRNDVALVELKKELPFAVRPLKIGSVSDMYSEKTVTVAGYGRNAPGVGAGVLRVGAMDAIVQKIFNFYDREGLYLVPKSNQAVCPGDSGGAVIKGSSSSLLLVGVNSLSNACKGAGDDTHSMSEILSHHRAWIQKYIPGI